MQMVVAASNRKGYLFALSQVIQSIFGCIVANPSLLGSLPCCR